MVNDVAQLVDENFIKVLSLHNFCPVPDSIEISKASPDYYSLASMDIIERKMAVAETIHTMDTACRLKAQAVVVHSGRLDIKDRTRELAKAVESGKDVTDLIGSMHEEREKAVKKGHLECLFESIKELLDYSKKTGIKIGLENRFYFRELPSIADFAAIFAAFKDSNLCYWHDTGHAQVYENLKLLRHMEYLEKFGHRLLGVHLHDVKGVINDHNAPFTGDFDFSMLKPFLTKKVIKILEPHAPAKAEDIKIAIGSAMPIDDPLTMNVRGRDMVSGLPRTIVVDSNDIVAAIQDELAGIIQAVKSVLQETPPELSADVIDKGMVFSGGGALLRNIDKLITQETGVQSYIADEPLLCVAKGTGVALENLESYKRSLLSSS